MYIAISEEEVLFEASASEAILAPTRTVEAKVVIASDDLEKQRPEAFSPEVRNANKHIFSFNQNSFNNIAYFCYFREVVNLCCDSRQRQFS